MSVLWISAFTALFQVLSLCYNLVRSLGCIFVEPDRKTAGNWGCVGTCGGGSPFPRLSYPHPLRAQADRYLTSFQGFHSPTMVFHRWVTAESTFRGPEPPSPACSIGVRWLVTERLSTDVESVVENTESPCSRDTMRNGSSTARGFGIRPLPAVLSRV